MTREKRRYKLTIDEAIEVTRNILARGQDVELRAINNGTNIIVYELNKKVQKLPALHETGN